MEVNLKKITTESRNPRTKDIDKLSTIEILTKINDEDFTVAESVRKALPMIEKCVDAIYETFCNSGRLIYIGAGTSGRIGVMDAVECPPTYSVPSSQVMCLMAGGANAFNKAAEGAEDSKELAVSDLKSINLSNQDIVIGIAASGRTPYVIGGIEYAKQIGAKTGCITTSSNSPLKELVAYPIEAVTGSEVITGSTRMKSGTAQKLICNMLTTASMIKMGKVYENLMIDVQATNQKLVSRAIKIVMEAASVDEETASLAYYKYGTAKKALFHLKTGIDDLKQIDETLDKYQGNIRKALSEYGG